MKIARLFLPGLFGPFSRDRIPVPPIRASILSHLEAHFVTILRNPLGKIERRSDESNVRHYNSPTAPRCLRTARYGRTARDLRRTGRISGWHRSKQTYKR